MEYTREDFTFIGLESIRPSGEEIVIQGVSYNRTSTGTPRYTRVDIYSVENDDKAYWLEDLEESDPENFGILLAHLGLIPEVGSLIQVGKWIIHTVVSVHSSFPGILAVTTTKWLEEASPSEKVDEPKGPDMVSRSVFLQMLPAFIASEFRDTLTALASSSIPAETASNIREYVQDEFSEELVTMGEVFEAIAIARSIYFS